MKKLDEYLGIQNFVIKFVAATWGAVMMAAASWPFVYHGFTQEGCETMQWASTQNWMMGVGFVLALGGLLYNSILKALIRRFSKEE